MVVVVMRVTTLKATAAKLPGLLAYYAGLAEDREPGPGRGPVDYYLDPDEPPGRWRGGGHQALGLDGNVEGSELRTHRAHRGGRTPLRRPRERRDAPPGRLLDPPHRAWHTSPRSLRAARRSERGNTGLVASGPKRSDHRGIAESAAILVLLAVSAVGLAVAPLVLDESYSWVEHTTSQAGGQGVDGAWMARLGFVLFGLAVIWFAARKAGAWRQPATALHVAFGTCLLAVAAFSLRSWQAGAPFDRTEDTLHSVAATVMGFAFALGVAAARWWPGRPAGFRVLDVVAIAASVVVPLAMAASTGYTGALQRAMFAVAYLWYAREVIDAPRCTEPQASARQEAPTDP